MTDEQKRVVAPSGAQTDATASGQPSGSPDEADRLTGEEARKAYPRQVEAAIAYASENTYDYGPKFRKLELDYEVVSARPMNDEIVRVVLSYQPRNKFKGESGSEYLDVDMSGNIQARRQISVPKESMPWVLASVAALSIIAAAVLIPFMLMTDERGDPLYVEGRTMYLRSSEPRVLPYVYYDAPDSSGTDRTWIVVPEGDGTEIIYVNLTLINPNSAAVNLAIDSDAVEVTTDDGITVGPINVIERVQWPAEGAQLNPRYSVLDLPLWGDELLQGQQQIQGFMAFEVPANSRVSSMRWAATDTINIRY